MRTVRWKREGVEGDDVVRERRDERERSCESRDGSEMRSRKCTKKQEER